MENFSKKIWKFICRFIELNILKTIYYRFKLNFPRNASFHIYPNSIVKISPKSTFQIDNGVFSLNESWFDDRARRYKSELRIADKGILKCEGDFKLFQGASIYVAPDAKLLLKGGGSFLNTNSTLNCFHYIEIGKGCYISDNVSIQDSDNHVIDGNANNISAPIIIEDHVWIGKNVTILKGVKIGEGAVVGAGSVVTRDIPARTIAVGNPAKVIKEIIEWK